MKRIGNKLDITRIITTTILAGVVLVVVLILRNEANLYWQAQLNLEEKAHFSQAVDSCLAAGTVSWQENGVATQVPHQDTFQTCLSKKGY